MKRVKMQNKKINSIREFENLYIPDNKKEYNKYDSKSFTEDIIKTYIGKLAKTAR